MSEIRVKYALKNKTFFFINLILNTMMTNTEKLKIVNMILPFLNSNKDCGLFPRKASMFAKLKPWQKGATIQSSSTKEITIAELMALSDNDLLDLEKKVIAAKKAKEVKKRTEGYNSRF